MGTTSRILVPSALVLCFCLIPLFTLEHVQELLSSLHPFKDPVTTPSSTVDEKYATRTYTLSTNPLEATQLVALSNDNFRPSPLYSDDGTLSHDTTYRSSLTATLPSSPITNTVSARAKSFSYNPSQGEKKIKPLVVQKYGLGKQYKDHYDWFLPHPSLTGNIESTFFVYISANCTGGGTNFPRLRLQSAQSNSSSGIVRGGEDDEWCEFIDCDRPSTDGVTFKPITGNALYWENVDEKGEGMVSTLHAGLPVTSGEKMGLNVWTWRDY